ncbi:MAG: 3'-5' exoribonuclease [Bacteroidaceae bacterium]|nr:3'-5' exoribonuclease [Bacteroidaceae bacterium]
MKHLDFTIDLETLARTPNSAIAQVAIVPWHRTAKETPFSEEHTPFVANININSCLLHNMDIEPETLKWWNTQDKDVKENVFGGHQHDIKDVVKAIKDYVQDEMIVAEADSCCVWAQGSDFDIAILRSVFKRFNVSFPFIRSEFRDARTFILEIGTYIVNPNNILEGIKTPALVYNFIQKLPNEKEMVHTALYDAMRTTWNVWNQMQMLNRAFNSMQP